MCVKGKKKIGERRVNLITEYTAMRAMSAEPLRCIDLLNVGSGYNWTLLDGELFLQALQRNCPNVSRGMKLFIFTFNKILFSFLIMAFFPAEILLTDLSVISLLSGGDYFPRLRGFSIAASWMKYLQLR